MLDQRRRARTKELLRQQQQAAGGKAIVIPPWVQQHIDSGSTKGLLRFRFLFSFYFFLSLFFFFLESHCNTNSDLWCGIGDSCCVFFVAVWRHGTRTRAVDQTVFPRVALPLRTGWPRVCAHRSALGYAATRYAVFSQKQLTLFVSLRTVLQESRKPMPTTLW